MKFDFNIGKVNRPIMSISKHCFTFNKEAIELIGSPPYISIGIDKESKKLAVRAMYDKSFDEPVYPFAKAGKQTSITLSATEVRNEAINLMSEKPHTGVSFLFSLDEATKFGIVDLTAGQPK